MIRAEVLLKRLTKLDEYLTILRSLQKYPVSEFVENPEHYGSAERFLQLAIESLSDMGNHIIAYHNLGVVDAYSDIPHLLYDSGYIDVELREVWISMIGFRNILVHGYLDIDREIVHQVLHEGLDDIEALKEVFAQFL